MPSDLDAPRTETRTIDIDGQRVAFEVDPGRPDEPAYFVLGVRKSGSTLLGRTMNFLTRRTGRTMIDWPGFFFRNGYTTKDWIDRDLGGLLAPGNVYGGFRSAPTNVFDAPLFRSGRKVLLVRDPRDALVSQYFSDAYSHGLPKADGLNAAGRDAFLAKREAVRATDIDTYVIERSKGIDRTMMGYAPLLDDPNLLLLKYEHVVFQKKWMIAKIQRHFGWDVHAGQVENLLGQIDRVPEREDKTQFVRKAIPGDHRAKLDPGTIRRLDNRLADCLRTFDYV